MLSGVQGQVKREAWPVQDGRLRSLQLDPDTAREERLPYALRIRLAAGQPPMEIEMNDTGPQVGVGVVLEYVQSARPDEVDVPKTREHSAGRGPILGGHQQVDVEVASVFTPPVQAPGQRRALEHERLHTRRGKRLHRIDGGAVEVGLARHCLSARGEFLQVGPRHVAQAWVGAVHWTTSTLPLIPAGARPFSPGDGPPS